MDFNAQEIGYVAKVHGVKGHIIILLTKKIKELSVSDALFLLRFEKKLPYFIREISKQNEEELILLFEEVSNREQAIELLKSLVYLSVEKIIPEKNNETNFIGYTLLNKDGIKAGVISDIFDMQEYLLFEVSSESKSFLVPFHSDHFIKIEKKKKLLQMDIPEGLNT